MDQTASTPVRRSGATWTLLALAALVTALPVGSAVLSVLRVTGVLGVDLDDASGDRGALGLLDERSLRIAEGFALLVSIPVGITGILVVGGLLVWKDWAREAALGVFGLVGALLLVLSANGLLQDPPGRNAGWGVLGSLLVLSVAALAVSPPVRTDWERKQVQRQLREREAATAARRARGLQTGPGPTRGPAD